MSIEMAHLKRKLRTLNALLSRISLNKSIKSKLKRRRTLIFALALSVFVLVAVWSDLLGRFQRRHPTINSLNDIQTLVEKHIMLADNEEVCEALSSLSDHTPNIADITWDRECNNDTFQDWVICHRSKCSINLLMVAYKGKIICDFTDIFWKNDFDIKFGRTYRTSEFYLLEESNYVLMNCTAAHGGTWLGVGLGTNFKPSKPPRASVTEEILQTITEEVTEKQYNLVVLILDSLSRNAFTATFPLSYAYLTKQLGGFVLKGYNIIGDDRFKNIMPILTGSAEFEMPDARRNVLHSQPYSFRGSIFEMSKKSGYVTGLNENVATRGVFTTRHLGFSEQPTDHYLRTYFLASQKLGVKIDESCVGTHNRFQLLLDYIKDIFWKHREQPKFLVNIHTQLKYDAYLSPKDMDIALSDWLKHMDRSKELNKTILIIMSDKGSRASRFDASLNQKIEERTPFVSFVLPESYRLLQPFHYSTFLDNINRLTTPFDLHSTLFLIVTGKFPKDEKSRAFSLLSRMPKLRSCSSAYIEPQWCACRSWEHIEGNLAETVAFLVVDTINKATKPYRKNCAEILLSAIVETLILKYQPNLLKFQGNIDKDGYEPDLNGNTAAVEETLRVKIAANPGLALFEGNVTFDRSTNKMSTNIDRIVRLVHPGSKDSWHCGSSIQSHLADFCVCYVNKT